MIEPIDYAMRFLLVVIRAVGMLAFMPTLGDGFAPRMVKALAAISIAVVLFPFAQYADIVVGPWTVGAVARLIASETAFAMAVGLAARMIFRAIRDAGEMIGHQMGLALSITSDPLSGVETTVVANICEAIMVLLFFAIGAHRWLIAAIYESTMAWPVGSSPDFSAMGPFALSAAARGLALAFQLASPIIALMFMIGLLMALMARLVPEIHILIVGFPMKVGLGMVGLLFFMPLLGRYGREVANTMIEYYTSFGVFG